MALALLTTTAFERDLKRAGKQGKDLDKLETVVNLLQEQQPLPRNKSTKFGLTPFP